MTAHTTQWAAKPESADATDSRVPSLPTEFLIANLGLEFRLTCRKSSPLKISNRKYLAISHVVGDAPHSVAQALLPVRRCQGRESTHSDSRPIATGPNRNPNRDTAIKISSNVHHYNKFQISNRDKTRVLRPPWREDGFASARPARNFQLLPQIDPAFARAYTYISPKEKPSWKIPSY